MSSQNDSFQSDQERLSVDLVPEIVSQYNGRESESPTRPISSSPLRKHRKGLSLNIKSFTFGAPSSPTKSLFLKRTISARPNSSEPRLPYHSSSPSTSVLDFHSTISPKKASSLMANSGLSPTRPALTPRSSFKLETSENPLFLTNNDSIFREHFSSSSNVDIADEFNSSIFSTKASASDGDNIPNELPLLKQEPTEKLLVSADVADILSSERLKFVQSPHENQIDDHDFEGVSSNSIEFDMNRLSTSSVLPSRQVDSYLLEGYIKTGTTSSRLSIPESLETVNSDLISQRDSAEMERYMRDDNNSINNNVEPSEDQIDQNVEIYVEEQNSVLSNEMESRNLSLISFIEDRPPSFTFPSDTLPLSESIFKRNSIYSTSAPTPSTLLESRKLRKTPSFKENPTQNKFSPQQIPTHPLPVIPIVDADGVPFGYKQGQDFPTSIHSSESETTDGGASGRNNETISEIIDGNSPVSYKVHPPINNIPHIYRIRDIIEDKEKNNSTGVSLDDSQKDCTESLISKEKDTELKKKTKKHKNKTKKKYSAKFDYNLRHTGENVVLYQGLVPYYPKSPSEDSISSFPYSNSMTTMKTTIATPEPPQHYLEIQERKNAELKKLMEKYNQKQAYQKSQKKANSPSKKVKRLSAQSKEGRIFHKHMVKKSTDSNEPSGQRRVLKNGLLLVRLPITQSPPKKKQSGLITDNEKVGRSKPPVANVDTNPGDETITASTAIDNSSRFEDAVDSEVSTNKMAYTKESTKDKPETITNASKTTTSKAGKHRNRISITSFIDNNVAKAKNHQRVSSDYTHLRQPSSDFLVGPTSAPALRDNLHRSTKSQELKYKKYFGTPSDTYSEPAGYFGTRQHEKIRSASMPFTYKVGGLHSSHSFINHTLNQNLSEELIQGHSIRSSSPRSALRVASVNYPPLSTRVNSYSTSPAMIDHDFITIGTQTLPTPYNAECDVRGRPYCSVALSRLIIGCSLFFPPLWLLIGAGYFDNAFGVIPKREKRIASIMGGSFFLIVIVGLCVGLSVGL
ncbi:hypothetical protein NADFUDRAFT_82010 [Nadsonia fulvescens var. elongata DSM 6958]|uniref:Uncharacterized protein n=1 Tax=Nadsonia fulvescens var. elongata DSM 6958 TaxID=857566 RepID=A0A1E3PQP4_9ASCO|nr:hypothetical protein NADFUDRAFT_82010 [Nadsonia fulvescens var. elongata DSM 6958]